MAQTLGWHCAWLVLCVMSYQQGDAGMRFIYNSQSPCARWRRNWQTLIPPNQPTNALVYGGTSGALDCSTRQRGIQLSFTEFRFAPDDNPEQYIVDHKIRIHHLSGRQRVRKSEISVPRAL